MFSPIGAFSGFSVKNQNEAKQFYTYVLGLEVKDDGMGLQLQLPGGAEVFVYEKENHTPASFTVLNLVVEDINAAVAALKEKGVVFEQYDFGNGASTDENSIMRGRSANMGPDIAWFKDPSGNVFSVLQN